MLSCAEDIRKRILLETEQDFKKFTASLIPNIDNVLGVRLPILRGIAKEVCQNGNWQEFLKLSDAEFMEETMLQGMIIGLIKGEPENILSYVKDFVPKINNWAVCDSFCTGLKFTNKNKKLVWEFIQPYLKSDKEYEIRFAVVMMLAYFIDDEHIDEILKALDEIKHEGYYVKMAVAWALSFCYIKQPEKTHKYLEKSNIDNWTFNKGIQKIRESFRVDKETKEILKLLKR